MNGPFLGRLVFWGLAMYIVILKYLKPIEDVERLTVPHRAYLDELYAKNVLLISGPQVPRTGGILVARSMDVGELWAHLKLDPFYTEGIAEYQVIEFKAVKSHEALKDLVG